MSKSSQLAKSVYQVYFGGNWTEVNLKDTLFKIPLELASKKIEGFNSILALAFHIHYFTRVQLHVLETGLLKGKDSESYSHPKINTQNEWEAMQKAIWKDAERFTKLITELPDSILKQPFTSEKYGTYENNILGLIEHTHYHLGQIVILNKMLNSH